MQVGGQTDEKRSTHRCTALNTMYTQKCIPPRPDAQTCCTYHVSTTATMVQVKMCVHVSISGVNARVCVHSRRIARAVITQTGKWNTRRAFGWGNFGRGGVEGASRTRVRFPVANYASTRMRLAQKPVREPEPHFKRVKRGKRL